LMLGPGAFFCFFFKLSSVSLLVRIFQKSLPRLLMALDDRVGGFVSQHKQILLLQDDALKPLCKTFGRSLLTSVQTKGVFIIFLLRCRLEELSGEWAQIPCF
jgi:hypothetical protein